MVNQQNKNTHDEVLVIGSQERNCEGGTYPTEQDGVIQHTGSVHGGLQQLKGYKTERLLLLRVGVL